MYRVFWLAILVRRSGTVRAQAVCQIGPYGYSPDWGIKPTDIPEPFRGPHFVCQGMQVSPPTRLALNMHLNCAKHKI
jgi:hypothetical protein